MNLGTVISRLLAVLALAAAVIAVILVIGSATGGDSDKPVAKRNNPAKKTGKKKRTKAKTYKVREGDNLSVIANRTGVPVDQLEELNPDLDPQALTIGQKLKLR